MPWLTDEVRHSASVSDMSHTVAPEVEPNVPIDTPRASAAERDNAAPEVTERQSPPQPDVSRFVAHLENENTMLRDQVVFLRDQVGVKDTQISAISCSSLSPSHRQRKEIRDLQRQP